jgi:hypothetical protein
MQSASLQKAIRAAEKRIAAVETKRHKHARPAWLDEEWGYVRLERLIRMLLDAYCWAQDPDWLRPEVYQDGGYAPFERLLQEYPRSALEWVDGTCSKILRADTYEEAAQIEFLERRKLPGWNLHRSGSRSIWLNEDGTVDEFRTHQRGKTTDDTNGNENETPDPEAQTRSDQYVAAVEERLFDRVPVEITADTRRRARR